MHRILLINPNYHLEIRWVADETDIDVKADYMPLGLATVAALTPEVFAVEIWDELVRGNIEDSGMLPAYDIVGVTSHSANLGRAIRIGDFFRQKGVPVVVGGPGVTSNPDRCRGHFDALCIGEAEHIWPQFLKDWQAGVHEPEYRQIEKPDIAVSPMPRWDSIASDVRRYSMGTLQTTRGCPNDCEFCDVVNFSGRRQRYKSVDQIIAEIQALQRLAVRNVSFNDDNFTIHHRRAKEVLRALIPVNNAFSEPLRYMTQLSIDVARDDELLELLADANFYEVLIGIESPNRDSLKECGKHGNLKNDLIEDVHKVLSYGIVVRGAMIVGFDHDDVDIFDSQYEFIQKACLPSVSMHMLTAPVGTRLWRRMRREGRVIDVLSIADSSTQRAFSNVIPRLMSRVQLMQGFRDLYARLFTWNSFRERMIGFISLAKRPWLVRRKDESLDALLKIGPSLHLDADACAAMEEIFRHTATAAPYLLGRVKELVVQFVRYRSSVHEVLPALDRQIEAEASGKFVYKLDNRPVTVSEGFRKAYHELFPEVHRRAYMQMPDKERVPEVLMEAFVEFLVQEPGIETVEEHHRYRLYDIVDRTCARYGGAASPADARDVPSGLPLPNVRANRLDDDVMKGVEQELFRLVQAKPDPILS